MRIFAIAGLAIVMATASAPSHAQQTDHTPTGLRAKLKEKYIERRDRFMHRVKDIYFAVGCKVLAREAGILPSTSAESYLAYVGDQTIIDTKDESLRQTAMQEGLDRAAKPGECDYYHKHPAAAEALRREAAAAAKR